MNEIGTESVMAFGVACSAVDFPGDQMNPGAVANTARYGSDAGRLRRHRTAALSDDVASVAAVKPARTPARFIPSATIADARLSVLTPRARSAATSPNMSPLSKSIPKSVA